MLSHVDSASRKLRHTPDLSKRNGMTKALRGAKILARSPARVGCRRNPRGSFPRSSLSARRASTHGRQMGERLPERARRRRICM